MSFLSDLFGGTSDREEAGKRMYGDELAGIDQLIAQIGGEKGSFDSYSTPGDVLKGFNLPGSTKGIYDAARRSLANQRTKSMQSARRRLGASSATPERFLSGIEGNFADAESNLDAQAAAGELENSRYNAGFSSNVLGMKDAGHRQSYAQRLAAMGLKSNAIKDYLGTLSDSTGLDDFLSLAGTAGTIAAAL